MEWSTSPFWCTCTCEWECNHKELKWHRQVYSVVTKNSAIWLFTQWHWRFHTTITLEAIYSVRTSHVGNLLSPSYCHYQMTGIWTWTLPSSSLGFAYTVYSSTESLWATLINLAIGEGNTDEIGSHQQHIRTYCAGYRGSSNAVHYWYGGPKTRRSRDKVI